MTRRARLLLNSFVLDMEYREVNGEEIAACSCYRKPLLCHLFFPSNREVLVEECLACGATCTVRDYDVWTP